MEIKCVRVSAVCNPRWDEAGYIGNHEEPARACEPLWPVLYRAWWARYAERCHACGGCGHVGTDDYREDCFYCGGQGEVMPHYLLDSEPTASPLCITDAGDCITRADILAQDLAALARELRRVNNIIRTECALDDEGEDQDREWEVTPSEVLDLCHRAYDLMQSNRLLIFVMVLSVPECDMATNARACFDALTELRMPLLAPFDEERPLARLRSRMGFDVKRPTKQEAAP